MHNIPENNINPESEITLYDTIKFIQDGWKELLVACIVGASLGFGSWFFLGSYKSEYILQNFTNTNTNAAKDSIFYGLDLITWRTLQKNLPNLAFEILKNENLSVNENLMYREMAEDEWWIRHVIPIYAISKSDAKNLAGISKSLDAASTTILGLNIYTQGDSSNSATSNALLVSNFIKSGGAYLQVKALLSAYEADAIGATADILYQISSIEIEQTILRDRAKGLEELQKRFPSNAGANQQLFDLKDGDAKYLPLTIQIIAVNSDINQNKERLKRLNDRLYQISMIKQFLEEALPLAEVEFDGILLTRRFLNIEKRLRQSLSAVDVGKRQALDLLRSQLSIIEARFTRGVDANTYPLIKKTGMLKVTVGGLVGSGLLMMIFLLVRKLLRNLKKI